MFRRVRISDGWVSGYLKSVGGNKKRDAKPSFLCNFQTHVQVAVILYVGKKRRSELLASEMLFCLSVIDNDVAKAFDEISDIIARRNRHSSEDVDSDLVPRL